VNDAYNDLAQDDDEDEYLTEGHWWSPSSVLTTGASAITAFTLAVAGVMGFVGYPVAEALLGFPDGHDDMRDRAAVSAMVVLLLLIGAFWLCHRVFLDDEDEVPAWARNVAGSAFVIAAIGTLLSTVTIIGSLLADSPSFPQRFL
jgi:uncharacterized BrkB/YihY/UPF0761 family membrane protein